MEIPSNWYESFFHGVAVELWRQAIPPEHTREEARTLVAKLDVPPGAEVLDVPCGVGRLASEVAAQGYRVTGVDLSAESLAFARAADPDGRVDWEHRDMRDLPWRNRFDAAFCTGNSFGYMDDEGNAMFLRAVAAALKPGGRFVLETPMVIESLLPMLKERPWYMAGDVYLLVANEYDARRGRLDIEYTFVRDGRIEVRRGTHRAYAYRELVALLESSGFQVTVEPGGPAAHSVTLVGVTPGH